MALGYGIAGPGARPLHRAASLSPFVSHGLSSPVRFLTGITTTGTPHLGNYVGAIRPAVQASRRAGTAELLLPGRLPRADQVRRAGAHPALHAGDRRLLAGLRAGPRARVLLPPVRHPRNSRADLAAHLRHRQGRAQPRPCLQGVRWTRTSPPASDPDADVTAGLFMYPVLMARRHPDVQGPQDARWAATRCSTSRWRATSRRASTTSTASTSCCPRRPIDESVAMLPGLDGRKMSKSYDNIIPLFAPRAQMQQADRRHRDRLARAGRAQGRSRARRCSRSTRPSPPPRKPAAAPGLCRRHRLGRRQAAAVRAHRPRDRADARALRRPDQRSRHSWRRSCAPGADKARAHRHALHGAAAPCGGPAQPGAPRPPPRQGQGRQGRALPSSSSTAKPTAGIYFKLVDAAGRLLAQSMGFDSPQEAGRAVAQLKRDGAGRAGAHPCAWPTGVSQADWRPRWRP